MDVKHILTMIQKNMPSKLQKFITGDWMLQCHIPEENESGMVLGVKVS